MAKLLGMQRWLYGEYENDIRPCPSLRKLGQPALGQKTKIELCVLERRRQGVTQNELAKTLGVSRLWVNRMEKGIEPADRLIAYWLGRS